jgi:hypothetical protein
MAMWRVGGEAWKTWEAALKTAVVDSQRQDGDYGHYLGSWDPVDVWGAEGGRVAATAMLAMTTEFWYRYDCVFSAR